MKTLDSPPDVALGGHLILDQNNRYRYKCCGLASPIRVTEIEGPEGLEWSLSCENEREFLEHILSHSMTATAEVIQAVLSQMVSGN